MTVTVDIEELMSWILWWVEYHKDSDVTMDEFDDLRETIKIIDRSNTIEMGADYPRGIPTLLDS